VFGLIIALCEGWSAFVGFLYFASNMTGLGNPLTDNSPATALGEAIDIVVSCWVLIFSGSAVGVIMHLNVVARLQRALPLRGAHGAAVLLGAVPGLVIGVAAAIGVSLAALEGWSAREGFEYMISAMCGLGNPLTNVSPESASGKVVAVVFASWQLAIGGLLIGLTGAVPLLDDGLKRLEKLCRQLATCLAQGHPRAARRATLRETFGAMDGDGSGFLSPDEVRGSNGVCGARIFFASSLRRNN